MLDHIDVHTRNFLALSPFCVLNSVNANGDLDASPRGDPPGFVAVLDRRTLLMPDRVGNNQVDSLRNIVEHPNVGLLFFVPGMNETLRVNGRAEIVTDPELLEPLSIRGRPPLSGLKITVHEVFLHCAKAVVRARLWDAKVQIDRSIYPTYGRVIADQIKGEDANAIDAYEEEACTVRL